MTRDRHERRHRRTMRHPECQRMMTEANFDCVPSLAEAMGLEEPSMWAIWDCAANDWVREMPSKVDDGGAAVLAFLTKREACDRAAKHWTCDTYTEARMAGWCEVRKLVTVGD